MPRPKVHDESLRIRLLEAAGQTLSTQGLAALSLRRLAADVGTSTTAVYSLFGGKPGLLKALFDEAFRRLGTHLATVTPSDDPVEDLVALSLAYRDSALADPHFYDVMFTSSKADLPLDEESLAAAAETFQPLVRLVERAIAARALRPDADPAAVSMALWAMVHGLVSLQLRNFLPPGAGEPKVVFEAAVRANVDGWRARG
ncbi:TetR/AcrR family transcriptional regulator [Pseudonocardia bannensis]|uniref:TetR/AcrR family transcriptional regulator n=1 Tax=Pseudonocardia bannensis TaxID=630973 RepID=A0A848DPZ0_9PSEU|nr:TetR/AcrR family transcriptional regulator [Pseudonocardia bannensis]NMH94593.1 TetR/AcrR family transcriptional regulator [Pseudonocardia bannensis]